MQFKNIIYMVIGIGVTVGVFFFLIWVGYKGFIAFALGSLISIYLILSKNPILMTLIQMSSSEDFIDALMEKDENNTRPKERDRETP